MSIVETSPFLNTVAPGAVRHAVRRALVSVASATVLIAGMGAAIAAVTPPAPVTNAAAAPPPAPAPGTFPDSSGVWGNLNVGGPPPNPNPFNQSLGTNGRSCESCHAPGDAWTATPGKLQKRFATTNGADPIFASLDGTNCPTLDVSTPAAHLAASSLLLTKGLIRVEMPVLANAEFAVTAVANPFGCTSTSAVSVYRRIPMSANLAFLSTVMWDGRATFDGQSINSDLVSQANTAVLGHSAATKAATATQLQNIVAFELGQFTAQISDAKAGALDAAGATGGTTALARQAFSAGANDPFGATGTGNGVPPQPVFTLYTAWQSITGTDAVSAARASIARGEKIFNTRPVTIKGVPGINDLVAANGLPRTVVTGTCGTCHNTPNAGSHSVPMFVNLGLTNADRRTADQPLVTVINKTTGATAQTTDPGRALVTGKWADLGKFKVPTLRGAAARAPYFHNGSAADLNQVVDFYNRRFALNLSAQEHTDLVAFLQTL